MLIRYFDPDEFAHLHWAYLVSIGQLPYRDFFFYIAPVFQWFLYPLFKLPPNPDILIFARLVQFLTYLGLIFLLYKITVSLLNRSVAILTILIFSVFPMTFDKTLEVRPDILMTGLFLASVYSLLKNKYFLSGLLFSLSLLVIPKIIFAIPAIGYLLFRQIRINKLIYFIIGLLIPFILFTGYLLKNNLLPLALQSIFQDSLIVNSGKDAFRPWVALSPFPLVYVNNGGISFPWIVNTAIWLAALAGLVILLVRKQIWGIFFLLFFTGATFFLFLFPVPYLQYFIPLTALASILAAILLKQLNRWLIQAHEEIGQFRALRRRGPSVSEGSQDTRNWTNDLSALILILLLISFFLQFRERIKPDNREQLGVIRDVLAISQPSDTFYDMVGSYVFRPDGYYICCHPYYEFIDKLSYQLPTLRDSLVTNQTKFVVLDRSGQSLWKPLPEDLNYLLTHYQPSGYPKIYVLK